MDVGIFSALEPAGMTATEHYADVIALCERAEQSGYSSWWTASRHLSPLYAAVGSPLVLLSAIASRTSRLRLGTAVVTLPLEDVVRLAEDYATLDAISAGRARLGVGSGDDAPAFAAMGRDFAARSVQTSELLPRLRSLIETGAVGPLRIYPQPTQSQLFIASQSIERATWAGEQGLGLMMGRSEPGRPDPTEAQTLAAKAYRAAGGTCVIVSRNAWVGSPDDPLLADAVKRHDTYLRSRGRDGLPGDMREALVRMHVPCGDPITLAQTLRDHVAPIEPDELLVTVDPGGLPPGEAASRLELLATELF